MIVYGSTLSPFVKKVMAFGAEKGIELELKFWPPGTPNPEFRAASPFRKMPAFRDGDFTLADSSAIAVYLDAIRPDPALIPDDPKARARTIWFDEYADTILGTATTKSFFNRIVAPILGREGDLAAAAKAEAEEIPAALDYLEGVIPPSGFLVEDRLTLADVAVAAQLANLTHCGARADKARHPAVAAYAETMCARPSFRALLENDQRIINR